MAGAISGKRFVLGAALVGIALIALIVTAFTSIGRDSLIRESRVSEARARASAIAAAIAQCSEGKGLPESGDAGLACSTLPRQATGFVYGWERISAAEGAVTAEGKPEEKGAVHVRVAVTCTGAGAATTCTSKLQGSTTRTSR